jgi:adenylate cyclase
MNAVSQQITGYARKLVARLQLRTAKSKLSFLVPGYIPPASFSPWPNSLKRRQVGILYADIAGYSRLTERDEEGTHRRMLIGMEILNTHIRNHRGRVAHFAGDAILAEFSTADRALLAAVQAQVALKEWNSNQPSQHQVQFRIGVNYGDVIAEHGDIYGNAVNLAARLEQLARSGGICVSAAVKSSLKDHSSIRFFDMGKRYVKNISEPVQAFWIECEAPEISSPKPFGAIARPVMTP